MRIAISAPAAVWAAMVILSGCGQASQDGEEATSAAGSELSNARVVGARGPAMRAPQQPGVSVSCEPSLKLPSRSTTTATCTVQASAPGVVDFELRGSSPGLTARALTQTGVLDQGGSVAFTLGVNAPQASEPGTVMVQARHASGWISELPIEVVPTPMRPSVHVVYLVPSDRELDPNVTLGLDRAMRHVQIWSRAHAGDGKALVFATDPAADFQQAVIALETPHAASWYSEAATPGDQGGSWRERVLQDARLLTGASPGDPDDAWVIAVDAEPAGGAGVVAGGIATLGSSTLRALAGAQDAGETTCQAVGRLGQAALLASGLTPSSAEPTSLSAEGWKTYPAATLAADEQAVFAASEFVSEVDVTEVMFSCSWQSP